MIPETRAPRRAGGPPRRQKNESDQKVAPAAANGNGSPVLNPKRAAAYLDVSTDTLARWRETGRGPKFAKYTPGRQGLVHYRIADLDRFLESCLQVSTSDTGGR